MSIQEGKYAILDMFNGKTLQILWFSFDKRAELDMRWTKNKTLKL